MYILLSMQLQLLFDQAFHVWFLSLTYTYAMLFWVYGWCIIVHVHSIVALLRSPSQTSWGFSFSMVQMHWKAEVITGVVDPCERSAMTPSPSVMHVWCAVSWDLVPWSAIMWIPVTLQLKELLDIDTWFLTGYQSCSAMELNSSCTTADTVAGVQLATMDMRM